MITRAPIAAVRLSELLGANTGNRKTNGSDDADEENLKDCSQRPIRYPLQGKTRWVVCPGKGD